MKLVFLSSSDIHGYILPTDYQDNKNYEVPFSLSRVSSVIKSERAKYGKENVVVADTGDCLQGSPLASYVHDIRDYSAQKTYANFYNAIGYDARCLGNHDFNYGLDYLKYFVDHTQAPVLNDNILDVKNGQPAFGKDFLIINKNGLKVGLLGITTQRVPYWEPKEHVAGLRFASAFEQIRYYSQILRPQVDVLAVLYHGGFEANLKTGEITEPNTGENEGYKILAEIPEIDVFLTGHQHLQMNQVVQNTAIVQPGYRGETVGKVILDIDDQSKKVRSMDTELIRTKDFEPDPEITSLATELNKKTQEWLDQPIAHMATPAPIGNINRARIEGAPFINLLQQMQLYYTDAEISATAVMSETANGFDTEVTMRDLLLNYPYANQLCRLKVTGKELRAIIEHSLTFLTKNKQGNIVFEPKLQNQLFNFDVFYPVEYEGIIDRPKNHRLTKLRLNGQPIEDERVYHLAVNNYRAMGGGFYPGYSLNKIEKILDKDYVQMFQQFLTQVQPQVDTQKNYHFY